MLGLPVRRPAPRSHSSRTSSALRRRIVLGLLVLLSLALITISFRESPTGRCTARKRRSRPCCSRSRSPSSASRGRSATPTAGRRTSSPPAPRTSGCKAENEQLQQQVIQNESALQENVEPEALLGYQRLAGLPGRLRGVAAEVIARPSRPSSRRSSSPPARRTGWRLNAPVVTADGLVGTVTSVTDGAARVRLLTDEPSAVSALDLRTRRRGVVRARPVRATRSSSTGSPRRRSCAWATRSSPPAGAPAQLASLYPKGIPIGRVTFVGRLNTDLYQQVLVVSDVDFSALDAVHRARPQAPAPEFP